MGTIRNEMTMIHHWNKDKLEKLREDAIEMLKQIAKQDLRVEESIVSMISPIMDTYINQEYTFIINGDCSKIGWGMSERFHDARMKWCEKHKHDALNIVVINFGEGDKPCRIVFDSTIEK